MGDLTPAICADLIRKKKVKGKGHPRTGHEGLEGCSGTFLVFI